MEVAKIRDGIPLDCYQVEFNVSKIPHYLESTSTYTVDDAVNKAGYGKFQIYLLFLAGLGWLADAFEIFILSVIGDYVACDFNMYQWQVALLTSMVFFGILVGSPLFGIISDIYGRKKSLAASMILLLVFGVASAFSPSYRWIVGLRTCMGVALGGATQGLTLCSEYCPANMRGKSGLYLCYFWSLGTFGVVLMAWVVMTYLESWKTLLVLTAFPSLLVVLSLKWYPESARFYLASNRPEKAVRVLSQLASTNGRTLPEGALAVPSGRPDRGRFLKLFAPDLRCTTLLLWYISFATAFTYYGVCLVSPFLIQNGSLNTESMINGSLQMSDRVPCKEYKDSDFIGLLWTSTAEFPGLLIFTFLIERIGRKWLLGCSCAICAILVLLLLLNTTKIVLLFILFACRGTILASFQLIVIVLSEVYPTSERALGMGAGMAFCRLGGLIVPFLSQVFVIAYPIAAMSLLSTVIGLAAVATALLPVETRGTNLKD